MKKFLTVALTSLCILGASVISFAAPPATQHCDQCGGTAYYSGTEKVFERVSHHMHPLEGSTVTVPCTMTVTGYVDTYRCNCPAPLHISRTEEIHQN